MEVILDIRKNVEKNAETYFEKAKKARKKLKGAEIAIKQLEQKLIQAQPKPKPKKIKREKEWFEKFRWFITSNGTLCIGGKDATSNEIVIKKHAEDEETVFHTELPGSPFFVIKGKPEKLDLEETAIATASFSRAWQRGFADTEVFHVQRKQLSKQGLPGEFVPKGAFMAYGKKNIMKAQVALAIGVDEKNRVMCGPETAIKKWCKNTIKIYPGETKKSEAAKKIAKKLNTDLDEVMQVLPAGEVKLIMGNGL